ncbi:MULTISPECIES: molybdopterin cofactor-binding domain-containing protein [Rahnella]|uniref:Molybdopterin-dependent oxidoreductase n=1 Tax=Rahnella laticis TaxID=2787622 RepID=A0ABS0E7N5_9GAMM|nr:MULTISPECIES: molybdopterin cofactor-binding domain-containing protein [Rahnella]MBF7981092.1 molybdopterin-dependent oxidoreductase [Rahnella laticis]MBF8001146.1 molybdopterin-dependent oxidoreductase [Rahnella sp. LAC-M12]
MDTITVGTSVPRVDGHAKVTGSAIYGDDIKMKNMLYGVCRYADIPAGKILRLDLTQAEKVPGVVKIATYKDIPGVQKIGIVIQDYLPIVNDEVFFHGDVIAVIAATTYEAACQASESIIVEYQAYEPLTDMAEAAKPEARLVHSETESNVVCRHHTAKGDIETGFAHSMHIFEQEYEVGYQEHAYIEPESVIVYPDPSEPGITIQGTIQNAHRVRGFVAAFLGLPQSRVNVKRCVLGGSFGGKDDVIDHLSCRAGLLALLTGKPVKFTYNREQSIRESCKRHPYRMKYKIGLDDNARIQAVKIDIMADSGGYGASSPFVTWRSVVQAAGPYNIPNVRIDIAAIATNNSYTSAFRGFGAPQVIFANESLMDEVARHFKISPIETRQRNILRQGDTSMAGQVFDKHIVSAEEVLLKASTRAEFEAKRAHFQKLNEAGGPVRYGIGLAVSHRGCSLGAEGMDASSALIQVNSDASINLSTSVSENGQGLQTSMSLIVAEAFGAPLAAITFNEPASSMIADGGSTVSSRGTLMGGQAVLNAATKIRQRMLDAITDRLHTLDLNETVWRDGIIINRNQPQLSISLKEAVTMTHNAGGNLSDYGWHVAPPIHWDEEKGTGSPYFTWVYGCQVVELQVDTNTGKITVNRVTAAHDVGKVINKVGFEGQVYGGVMQGLGYALLEDFNIEHGRVKSENFDTYLIPTIRDMPAIDIIAVENHDISGPYGAKVIGEPVLELAAAASNNALNFALGCHNTRIPLTLEQVKLGYNLKKPLRQSEALSADTGHKHVLRLNTLTVNTPDTLPEALEMLAQPGSLAIAGGTDVLVQARMKTSAQTLVDISRLSALKGIELHEDGMHLGAGVCFSDLVVHPQIKHAYPLLVTACKTIGSLQLRNRATLGGNIINAAPCADSVPPLIIYDADVVLVSQRGERRLPLSEFITAGYKTQLTEGELMVKLILPVPSELKLENYYSQLGRRNALNITRQSLTCQIALNAGGEVHFCRLVDGALFSKPQRLPEVEEVLLGHKLDENTLAKAEDVLMEKMEKAIGGRWSAAYKMPVFLNMFRQMMNDVRHANHEGAGK